MRRSFPIFVCFAFGMAMLIQFFIPTRFSRDVYNGITDWAQIIYAFALIVGVFGLVKYQLEKIARQRDGWIFSLITILALVIMAVLGFAFGRKDGGAFMWAFNNIQAPMQASVFSLLAFFVASAAYRGFTARNTEAVLLLLFRVVYNVRYSICWEFNPAIFGYRQLDFDESLDGGPSRNFYRNRPWYHGDIAQSDSGCRTNLSG